jgi:hypothetical protein
MFKINLIFVQGIVSILLTNFYQASKMLAILFFVQGIVSILLTNFYQASKMLAILSFFLPTF